MHSLCRYEFFLQLKQDIQMGRLECPFETAVELGSYALQCEYLSTRQGALILGSPPPPFPIESLNSRSENDLPSFLIHVASMLCSVSIRQGAVEGNIQAEKPEISTCCIGQRTHFLGRARSETGATLCYAKNFRPRDKNGRPCGVMYESSLSSCVTAP